MSSFEPKEVSIATVWPSVAASNLGPLPVGRWLGQLYAMQAGVSIFNLGNLSLLLSIPLALVLYFLRLLPYAATRYRLTNCRVVVERGLMPQEERSVELERFNAIDIVVLPGYEWYYAGDLVFRLNQVETFRISGVTRPEAFRTIRNARVRTSSISVLIRCMPR